MFRGWCSSRPVGSLDAKTSIPRRKCNTSQLRALALLVYPLLLETQSLVLFEKDGLRVDVRAYASRHSGFSHFVLSRSPFARPSPTALASIPIECLVQSLHLDDLAIRTQELHRDLYSSTEADRLHLAQVSSCSSYSSRRAFSA